jgi:hypothetical protein
MRPASGGNIAAQLSSHPPAGLPDGIFSTKIFEGLAKEDVGLFHVSLVDFRAIWYNLWPFGTFYGYLVKFSQFWYVVQRNVWQP